MWPHTTWRLSAAKPYMEEDVEMDWVRLKGPMSAEFMHILGTSKDRPWARAVAPQKARILMRKLQALALDYPPDADLTAIAILHQLAAACRTFRPESRQNQPIAQRIHVAMEQHIGSGMNVTDYARAFKISRSRMFLIFKETFGRSPVQVLGDIRMRHSSRLLKDTNMSIREVAFAVGYRDPLYFSRQFQKQIGMAPSEFRRNKK